MFKKILLHIPIVFLIGCGSGDGTFEKVLLTSYKTTYSNGAVGQLHTIYL